MDRFHGLTPLWDCPAERERVIDSFFQAAQNIDTDLVQEVARLDRLAARTLASMQQALQRNPALEYSL
jgi:hypothetical protein